MSSPVAGGEALRLVIDLRWVRSELLDGIARVSLSLTAALLAEYPEDCFLLLFETATLQHFALNWMKRESGQVLRAAYETRVLGFSATSPRNRWQLWTRLAFFRPQLYLSYYYCFQPLPIPQVCMVHDLIPWLYPAYFRQASLPFRLLLTRSISLRWLIGRAQKVLTVSQNTRRDLVHGLGVPSERVAVCYPGIAIQTTAAPSETGFAPGYILSLGRPDPHKNFAGLIRAYALLPERLRAQHPLVLAGPHDPRYSPALETLVQALDLTSEIHFAGPVASAQLPELYRQAAVFALVSLYEGFGLPVLEAMSCGVPVVTSQRGSLPEVAGEAALLVDPEQPEAIAEALERVLAEPDLAAELVRRGQQRAAEFTWQRSAHCLRRALQG